MEVEGEEKAVIYAGGVLDGKQNGLIDYLAKKKLKNQILNYWMPWHQFQVIENTGSLKNLKKIGMPGFFSRSLFLICRDKPLCDLKKVEHLLEEAAEIVVCI